MKIWDIEPNADWVSIAIDKLNEAIGQYESCDERSDVMEVIEFLESVMDSRSALYMGCYDPRKYCECKREGMGSSLKINAELIEYTCAMCKESPFARCPMFNHECCARTNAVNRV